MTTWGQAAVEEVLEQIDSGNFKDIEVDESFVFFSVEPATYKDDLFNDLHNIKILRLKQIVFGDNAWHVFMRIKDYDDDEQ